MIGPWDESDPQYWEVERDWDRDWSPIGADDTASSLNKYVLWSVVAGVAGIGLIWLVLRSERA